MPLTFFCVEGRPWFTFWYNVENQSIVLFRTILMMWRVRFLAILYYADQWHRLAGSNTDLDPITSGLWLPGRHHDEKDNLSPECAVCKVDSLCSKMPCIYTGVQLNSIMNHKIRDHLVGRPTNCFGMNNNICMKVRMFWVFLLLKVLPIKIYQ